MAPPSRAVEASGGSYIPTVCGGWGGGSIASLAAVKTLDCWSPAVRGILWRGQLRLRASRGGGVPRESLRRLGEGPWLRPCASHTCHKLVLHTHSAAKPPRRRCRVELPGCRVCEIQFQGAEQNLHHQGLALNPASQCQSVATDNTQECQDSGVLMYLEVAERQQSLARLSKSMRPRGL